MHQIAFFVRIRYERELQSFLVMRKDYEKLFTFLKAPEPPEGLLEKIMQCIHEETRFLTLRQRYLCFALGLIGSAVAFIPALRMLESSLAQSGFMEFLSLIFSDSGIVLAYWQDFGLLLLESLPVMGIVAVLALALVFLESLRFFAKHSRSMLATINS